MADVRRRRRTSGRATTPALERARLRRYYLELYAADPRFGDALVTLFNRHRKHLLEARNNGLLPGPEQLATWFGVTSRRIVWDTTRAAGFEVPPGSEAIAAYVDDVNRLAQRVGLDHIRDFPGERPSVGHRLVHEWCWYRLVDPDHDPHLFGGAGHLDADWEPSFGEVLYRRTLGEIRVDGVAFPVVDGRRSAVVHVKLDVPWNPLYRSREQARRAISTELEGLLSAELDRIQDEATAAGLVVRDARPNTGRDIRWTWLRVRHGTSFEAICARTEIASESRDASFDVSTVRKAVDRMAGRLGVTLPGERKRKAPG